MARIEEYSFQKLSNHSYAFVLWETEDQECYSVKDIIEFNTRELAEKYQKKNYAELEMKDPNR